MKKKEAVKEIKQLVEKAVTQTGLAGERGLEKSWLVLSCYCRWDFKALCYITSGETARQGAIARWWDLCHDPKGSPRFSHDKRL